MPTVLVLSSSALGDASISSRLVRDAVAELQTRHPGLDIIARDLGADPVPHLTEDSASVLRGAEPANAAQARARALSDELIAELRAADIILIGAPMYNFGIATTLKAWFDYVLRAGVTFRYGENGAEGLLTGKRAIIVETRGGLYSEGPGRASDSQEPHLLTLLNFAGITDVTFIRAEKLAFGAEASEAAIGAARAEIGEVIEAGCAATA